MNVLSVGGGPAGLYFALLWKKRDPQSRVTVVERNRPGDTFGFGVVFSDATLDNLAAADAPSHRAITGAFAHWGDIDIFTPGGLVRSTGHGFAGLGRRQLLELLYRRCEELGVELRFGEEVSDFSRFGEWDLVLGADGVNSAIRGHLAAHLEPDLDLRPNRFVWLGTSFPFAAFTFYFKQHAAGLFRVHAYRYSAEESTFIVECREATWRRAGLDRGDEAATLAFCEALFAEELAGHRLLANRSVWRQFPTVRLGRWHHRNVVLLGDAAHTAHFSIGSGTKLAIEDAIALEQALAAGGAVEEALDRYEAARRPMVDSTQRAAAVSLAWFEETERYLHLPPLQFAASLLTRSLRVTHESLKLRDPAFIAAADHEFATAAAIQSGVPLPPSVGAAPTPPMLTPFRLRELVLPNRVVVSPMCQYSADDGTVTDWHLVHLGSRAVGGAGLLIAEMTAISAAARITPGCAGLYRREHAVAWGRIVDFVHHHSPAKIGVQLGHAGRKGSTMRPWEGPPDEPLVDGGWPILAPSPRPYRPGSQTPRAMVAEDFASTLEDYRRATRLAEAAGFDLLELHSAHGYLLGSFLSPLTNQRQDEYGGDVAGRARFPLAVVTAVRALWPATKPLACRLSATDWAEGGLSPDDLLQIVRWLRDAGVDLVDVSAGQTVAHQRPRYGRLFQTPFADRIRNEVGVATMTVGAISTHEDVNSILLAGRADLVALARGHLYDPYFTRHAAFEQGAALPWPPPYATIDDYNPRPGKRS